MVKKKGQSKRLSLHKKYKILGKVREHKRKVRKHERTHGKKVKNPGIPNTWPFKEELMQQVENQRLTEIQHASDLKAVRREEKKRLRAEEKARFDALSNVPDTTPHSIETAMKAQRKAAIESADLILIVLDARDPLGSRSLSFEDGLVGKAGKPIALVLNKVDLIDPSVASKWTRYLRRFYPTIAVKSLNNNAKELDVAQKKKRQDNASIAWYSKTQSLSGVRDNGDVSGLSAFLTAFCKKCETKPLPKVAVIGYPNVGKSTLVNSLKKKQVVNVSSEPLTTRSVSSTQLGNTCMLLDCPPLDVEYSHESSFVTRHAISSLYLLDPTSVINSLLSRVPKASILNFFRISVYKNTEDFLSKLAIKQKLLRKGGEPNLLLAGRTLLKDLGKGVVPFMTVLPNKKSNGTGPAFEMPAWYKALDGMTALLETEFEPKLYANALSRGQDKVLTLTSVPVSNPEGHTTEFDILMGDMSAFLEEDQTSSEEDDDDMNTDE